QSTNHLNRSSREISDWSVTKLFVVASQMPRHDLSIFRPRGDTMKTAEAYEHEQGWDFEKAAMHYVASLYNTAYRMIRKSEDADVKRALDALPHDYKMVVLLADIEGFSYKEIAEILDCPVGTVMSRLYRGRKMLERTLLEYARKYGYIRAGIEPAKMRSRKDETKGRKKKEDGTDDETEVTEPDESEEEVLFAGGED